MINTKLKCVAKYSMFRNRIRGGNVYKYYTITDLFNITSYHIIVNDNEIFKLDGDGFNMWFIEKEN